MKVSEYLKDYADPRGSAVSHDIDAAILVAAQMRGILNQDLEEIDIAQAVFGFNNAIDNDEMMAAWDHLNAGERRAWREYYERGKYANR
jgi:hypothetical protein